jgi:hypothetical protein
MYIEQLVYSIFLRPILDTFLLTLSLSVGFKHKNFQFIS